MSIKYLRTISVTLDPLGNVRSLPAQVGTAAPLDPVIPPKHMEYPQQMSLTAPELAIPYLEPGNDSTFALPGASPQPDNTETVL